MATPVTKEGNIDVAAVEKIVDNMASHQCAPLIMGVAMIAAAKKASKGRVVIYAGLQGTCIAEQYEAAKAYIAAGADVIAATLPSYYALTDEQMEKYYTDLADFLTVPLMLYNITITTHMSIPVDVIEKLSHHPNIVGLKDSENNIPRLEECCKLFADREDFAYFCGCAANSCAALKNGGDGIVPSVGNYLPQMYQDLYEAGVNGDWQKCQELQDLTIQIGKINTARLTLGQSLAGLKVIMNMVGLCEPYMLAPLTELPAETVEKIKAEAKPVIAKYL